MELGIEVSDMSHSAYLDLRQCGNTALPPPFTLHTLRSYRLVEIPAKCFEDARQTICCPGKIKIIFEDFVDSCNVRRNASHSLLKLPLLLSLPKFEKKKKNENKNMPVRL